MVRQLLFGIAAWAVCATAAPAQSFDIKTIDPESFRAIAVKISDAQRPSIDGKLTDEAWALAAPQGNFIQREPNYGAASTEQTEFRILYDDKTLYIGVWVWDSDPAGIMGSEMKRDGGLNKGDQLKITIDTFHEHRNALLFQHQPARRLQGRQHRRKWPHHQLRLERGLGQQRLDRRARLVLEIAIRSTSCVQDDDR